MTLCSHGCIASTCNTCISSSHVHQQSSQQAAYQSQAMIQSLFQGQSYSITAEEYEDVLMNRKYAHLSTQEKVELFSSEHGEMKHKFEEQMREIKLAFEQTHIQHEEKFFKWCQKYCPEISKDRFNKFLKAFL